MRSRNHRKPSGRTASLRDFDASELASEQPTLSQEFWVHGNAQAIVDAQVAQQQRMPSYQPPARPTQIIEQVQNVYDAATLKFVAVTFFFIGFISSSIFMMLIGILYLLDFFISK